MQPRPPKLTTVALKQVVAVTGTILGLFVLFHMIGNLQIYLGAEVFNRYAHFLKSIPELLWPARLVLLGALLTHVGVTIALTVRNLRARPERYVLAKAVDASIASRMMLPSGLILLGFIIYHLMHFTLGITNPDDFALTTHEGEQDVYAMVVTGFRNAWIAIPYMIAMSVLGFHLIHGVAALFQTYGLNSPYWRPITVKLGVAITAVIVLGYVSIPILCLIRVVPLPEGVVAP